MPQYRQVMADIRFFLMNASEGSITSSEYDKLPIYLTTYYRKKYTEQIEKRNEEIAKISKKKF